MKYLFSVWMLLFLGGMAAAQEANFQVRLSADRLHPGDTLDLVADYGIAGRNLPPATLVVAIDGGGAKKWQGRWPIINGHAEGSLVLPAQMEPGVLTLYVAVQPRFLKFYGELVYPRPPLTLLAYWPGARGMEKREIKVPANGRFELKDLNFEGTLDIGFDHFVRTEAAPPLIRADAWLDSSFQPAAAVAQQIAVNRIGDSSYQPASLNKKDIFASGYEMFYARWPFSSAARRFPGLQGLPLYDSLYLQKPFLAPADRVVDCIADSVTGKWANAYALLQKEMKGLAIVPWYAEGSVGQQGLALARILEGESMIRWNGKWYRIHFKQQYGDVSPLLFPLNAFAAIRVYEPPFLQIPQSKESVGVIAFFERRFPFENPFPYHHRYRVRGYTPSLYSLPL